MRKILVSILLSISSILIAQSSKKDLIGYWQSQDDTTNYFVFSKEQSIRFSISAKYGVTDLYYTYGFSDELKLKNINDLKDAGIFYYEVNEDDFQEKYKEKDGTYSGIQANVIQMDEDKKGFQIYDPLRPGQRGTYKRIKQLPLKLENILKSKNIIIDSIIKENKAKYIVKVTKSIIYCTPNKPTKMYLLKGDVVEILQEKDDWLQIRYYGKKTIEGWIKKSDVE